MLFVTRYSVTGDRSKERVAELMAVFGERGEIPGTVAHYTALDGRGGFVIIETDAPETLYDATLAYQPWLEMETVPIMKVEDAVPAIIASLE